MSQLLLKNTKYTIIPNGVDFNKFYPINKINARQKLNIEINKKIVLFVAEIENSIKNYKLCKTAFDLITIPEKELLVINRFSQDILNLYYNAADVLVLTSFHEGSPNVIKEAAACNLPIISTDVGDVREIIGAVKGCFIVPYDANIIADKLNHILTKTYRTESFEKINFLDSEIIANKIIHIYRELKNQYKSY